MKIKTTKYKECVAPKAIKSVINELIHNLTLIYLIFIYIYSDNT